MDSAWELSVMPMISSVAWLQFAESGCGGQ
jgi:hypothetical protein